MLAIVLLLPWAGCLGEGQEERLASESATPPTVPTRATPKAPTVTWNFNDPGYAMTASWRIGDGWDYESNESRFRRVRVIDQRNVHGALHFIVQESTGRVGNPAEATLTSWVDSRTWSVVNVTEPRGGITTFSPGDPLRYFKNGSHTVTASRFDASGRLALNTTTTTQVRHYATHQTLLFPWGYVEARRVEEASAARDDRGNRDNHTLMRWVHRDYLLDVQYQLDGRETYKLVAVKAGDFRRGTLVGHGG